MGNVSIVDVSQKVMADRNKIGAAEENAGHREMGFVDAVKFLLKSIDMYHGSKLETLWIVMLCLSTAGYCQRVWKKYEESPIIFSFGNNSKSLSEKPFPVVTGHFKNPSFAHGRKTLKWRQDKNETFSNNWNLENGYQLPEDDTGTTTPVVICNASEQCFGNVKFNKPVK
ncbi:hypothetical protein LSTR_LSTR008548 [Laodelphax striatellus]|uniref:Uncharacterized protein n=1 Tax=Laodelphax striatellus TaxID=195883 RepID=A0A482WSI9_LAOST|nr:hypothetical protein LSTR_LSTR008548 [Laodelphax striatellus]